MLIIHIKLVIIMLLSLSTKLSALRRILYASTKKYSTERYCRFQSSIIISRNLSSNDNNENSNPSTVMGSSITVASTGEANFTTDLSNIAASNSLRNSKKIMRQSKSLISREEILDCVRLKDFELACKLYHRIKDNNITNIVVMYCLIGVCEKKEHLSYAKLFFNEIIRGGSSPSEQAYLSLIRCYLANDQIDDTLSLIESMIQLNVPIKHRIFQHVLDYYYSKTDLENILNILFKMIDLGIYPRSDQIVILLKASLVISNIEPFKKAIVTVINETSKDLIGLEYEALLELKGLCTNISREEVIKQGILVDSVQNIPGRIMDENEAYTLSKNASFNVVASLESFEDTRIIRTVLPSTETHYTSTPSIQKEHNESFTSFESYGDNLEDYNVEEEGGVSNNSRAIKIPPSFVDDQYVIRRGSELPRLRAQLIDIGSSTCECPNCGAKLRAIPLPEDAKRAARVALLRVVSSASLNNCKNLETFSSWLEEREPFKFIVDGANVAYNKQNYGEGKFSFKQIEIVVEAIRASTNDRILVLLPQSYAQKVIPNNTKRAGRKYSFTTAEDQRILSRLQDEDMVYIVPSGADDDWYWLYATVAENRNSFAITNDLTRDHRLAFLESRMYIRWRNNHIIHFDIDKQHETPDGMNATVRLTYPEQFSREIQFENNRWHFPATDRHAWLCLDLDRQLSDS